MIICRSIEAIRSKVLFYQKKGKTVGFVPTMGYLHKGHLSLIRQAKIDCDICVVSIFVNPLQFGPHEDFKKYPRNIKRDECLSNTAGADIIFYPSEKEMYPSGYLTYVEVECLSSVLCGSFRPGHFKGVTTVVVKLFNIITPDIAYFGQKDIQQSIIIQRMVKDLNMPLKVKIMPIVREADGLALSSRNVYLNKQGREDAVVLSQALSEAKTLIKKGERSTQKIISAIKRSISFKKSARIEYAECVEMESLSALKTLKGKVIIALAVRFGKTRLIDNLMVKV